MNDGVKLIFKVLLGTIIGIFLLCAITEFVNIELKGIMLQNEIKLACDKALTLFSQESYKPRGGSGDETRWNTVIQPDVVNHDGGTYVSGDFYNIRSIPNDDRASSIYKFIQ